MKIELEKKLIKDFPNLYKPQYLNGEILQFEFECGSGWFSLIYELSERLTKIDLKIQVEQVKENFGELRFYVEYDDKKIQKEVQNAIDKAEIESCKTCEYCGSKENVTTDGPKFGAIKTLCNKCRKE